MKRLIEKDLLAWKDNHRRKPLILRGARQVGKTFSVEKFGREHFSQVLTVDLEKNREWHRIFAGNLAARQIMAELELVLNAKIVPGRTLLFLDEIQNCPRAIMALRYFFEESPELHVIAAGSLLEFALGEISVPVGRVQYLDLHPLTFGEYLWAVGREEAAALVFGRPQAAAETVHRLLLAELKTYCFAGGMPESVKAYADTKSLAESFAVQRELVQSFRQDFAKYAPRADPHCLDAVFLGLARSVGQQVKYAKLAEGYANPTLKRACEVLCRARLARKVPAVNPVGLPLGASASARKFKALLVDIGLWQNLCGLKAEVEYPQEDLLALHRGALAEQFVGQELTVAQSGELYYWARGARGSSAEVDYLAVVDGAVRPVEVKSGAAGRLRSLHLLLASLPGCPGGLVFSAAPFRELPEQRLTFLPLYFAFSATRGRQPGSLS